MVAGWKRNRLPNFLIFDESFPRSFAYSYDVLDESLTDLVDIHGQDGASFALIKQTQSDLLDRSVESIFEQGLHEFVLEFIACNQSLASAIAEDYRFVS